MSDPISASIVIILGKYALDKGAELAKEVGPAAAEKAKELFGTALNYLRKDPDKKVIADRYEDNPSAAQPLLELDLADAIQNDPDFAAQLKQLLAQYEEAAQEHAAATGTTYKATLKGSGAIAQGPGAKAVGERGVFVEGDATGPIVTGDSNKVTGSGDIVGGDKITTGHISGSGIAIGRDASASVTSGRVGTDESEEPIQFQWTDAVSGQTLSGRVDPVALRKKLADHFSLDELSTLCFDLGVAADDVPGQTREAKAREMVDYFARRKRLPELLAACRQQRPKVNWLDEN